MRLGSAVLTGILLAKSGLSTAEIGAWEMLLYLGTTLTFFWVNGLLQGIAPVYSKLDEVQRKTFIFNHFLLFCGIAASLFLLLFFGEKWIAPALTGLPEVPHFKLFALYLLLNLPTFPVEYFYLLQERPRSIVVWGVISFGLHVLALFVPIQMGLGLEGGISALVILSGLKFLWTTGLVLQFGRVGFDKKMIVSYLIFCAPLMLSNVVSNLMLIFDNWLVGWHFGDPALFAVYRYGAREFPLATALVSALGVSLIPLLTNSPKAGLAELKAKSRRLMHLLFPLTIILLCISKPLFPIVFNPDFAASASLFNIYLLTLASRILLPASIVLAKGDSRSIFWVSLLELCVKFVLGFLFIQYWGLPGLAYSVVISYWVEKLGLIWILEKKHGVRTSDWVDWNWYLGYGAALGVAYWVSLYI
ncbi:MAG: lipid II flippase MurJ [Saprospiraceae bacterium]|nr:lipid II flippase MurJ [Saprospiraceae bacterium]